MSYPLSHLFRSLIDIHTIPTEWKNSTIIPKFKKGAPSDPSNYRPIALTCTCCKILESIISCELSQYLLEHKLITHHQHGFLKRHSTSTNLLESTYDWTIALSNRNSVSVAYIDFKSAFDRISHSKLLLKLSGYGINGKPASLDCIISIWPHPICQNKLHTLKFLSCYQWRTAG